MLLVTPLVLAPSISERKLTVDAAFVDDDDDDDDDDVVVEGPETAVELVEATDRVGETSTAAAAAGAVASAANKCCC